LRSITLLLPLFLVSTAQACLNDRDSDSLALQAKKLPDTLQVITGRFERNPPLYYEMRIRRSLAGLKVNPRRFDLYDDVAVAYDRLHKDNEALRVMAVKRSLLPEFNGRNAQVKEDWYRYYANAGTFYAHRWLGAGARKKDIGEMKKARDYIRRAIQIKPKAHFGREAYQLMTMEWIIATRERKSGAGMSLGKWIATRDDALGSFYQNDTAVQGLSGLVILGAAWQSADVFEALAEALNGRGGTTLRYLALLRCREILHSGKSSLSPETLDEEAVAESLVATGKAQGDGYYINSKNQKALDELFPKLRIESDIWAGHRSAYLLAGLEKGRHPDVDAGFWKDWKPAEAPDLDIPWWDEKWNRYGGRPLAADVSILGALTVLFGALGAALVTLRMLARRRLV
jgi:hypothetical protein